MNETQTADSSGPGAVERTTATARRTALIAIGVIFGLFAAVNTRQVRVSFMFGDVTMPLIIVILITLLAGMAIGWLAATLRKRGS